MEISQYKLDVIREVSRNLKQNERGEFVILGKYFKDIIETYPLTFSNYHEAMTWIINKLLADLE